MSARDDPRRAEARRLRVEDELSVAQIAERLGVSVGVAGGWVRGLPIPEWTRRPRAKDAQRARAVELRGQGWSVNRIAVAYSCEGAKEKLDRDRLVFLQFINRDLRLILVFLRYMEQFGYRRSELRYRVSIHQTADAAAATRSWSEDLGVPIESFLRATIKKHNPQTRRKDTGEHYRGCLSIYVPKSGRLNWEIDAIVEGVALGLGMEAPAKM